MKLKNKISIYISQENINHSRNFRGNPCLCPIAMAMCEKYGFKPKNVYISPESVIFDGKRELYYQFNEEAIQFMSDFDTGKFCDPITVEANLVREYVRQ